MVRKEVLDWAAGGGRRGRTAVGGMALAEAALGNAVR